MSRRKQSEIFEPRVRLSWTPHPLRLYRTKTLAVLLGVNPSTIWRWERSGVLPRPVEIGGLKGWTEPTLQKWLEERTADAA